MSEPDSGIYDAMNKGISLATGEWINFMNAGDRLVDNFVLEKVFKHNYECVDVIYGSIFYVLEGIRYHRKPKDLNLFYQCMPFCHQAVFTKTKIQKKYVFDLNYNICADFNFYYNLYINDYKFYQTQETIAYFLGGGLSNTKNINKIFENLSIVKVKSFKVYRFYAYRISKAYLFFFIKKIIGKKLTSKVKLIKANIFNHKK